MATYIMLFRYTQQGIENIKQGPARVDAAKQAAQALGAQVKEFYAVMGRYDTVFVLDAPELCDGLAYRSTGLDSTRRLLRHRYSRYAHARDGWLDPGSGHSYLPRCQHAAAGTVQFARTARDRTGSRDRGIHSGAQQATQTYTDI